MNLWVAYDLEHAKKIALETLIKPVAFPCFQDRPNELRTERIQRWRSEYKELSERQHKFILSVVCHALSEAQGIPSLQQSLQKWADHFAASRDLDLFSFRCVEPLSLGIDYRLSGSSRTHHLSVSTRSPSEELR